MKPYAFIDSLTNISFFAIFATSHCRIFTPGCSFKIRIFFQGFIFECTRMLVKYVQYVYALCNFFAIGLTDLLIINKTTSYMDLDPVEYWPFRIWFQKLDYNYAKIEKFDMRTKF
jgi:hypothetical protein